MITPRANLLLVATTASAHRMHRACFPSVGLRAPDLRAYRIVARAGSIPMASAANLGLEPPSEDDIRVIEERQLGHKMSNIIGVGMRCKHGYPQAFAFDPVRRAPWAYGERKSKIESGLFRLSCPLLVKAVDEWEAEGAVKKINEEVVGGTAGSGTNQGSPARTSGSSARRPAATGRCERRASCRTKGRSSVRICRLTSSRFATWRRRIGRAASPR